MSWLCQNKFQRRIYSAFLPFIFLGLILFGPFFLLHVKAQKLSGLLNYARFRADSVSNYLEINLSFEGRSIGLIRTRDGKFQAGVNAILQIDDSTKSVYAEKFNLLSPVQADSTSVKGNLSVNRKIAMPNGKFNFSIEAFDLANPDSGRLKTNLPLVFNFPKGKMFFSDLQLLAETEKINEQSKDIENGFIKNGYLMLPYPLSFYPAKLNTLKFYSELYNSERVLGHDSLFVVTTYLVRQSDQKLMAEFGSVSRLKAKPLIARLTELDIKDLPSGIYDLVVEAIGKNKSLLARQRRTIERLNPFADDNPDPMAPVSSDLTSKGTFLDPIPIKTVQHILLACQAIASNMEAKVIATLSKSNDEARVKSYVFDFFKRRNKDNPEMAYRKFARDLEYVDKVYRSPGMRSYETDRGRVYLQYGKPDQIENEYNDKYRSNTSQSTITPYEIWQYYHTEQRNQSNILFVFVQQNLGNNNYRLLHSSAIGEVNYPNWRTAISNSNNGGGNQFNLPNDK